MAKIDLPQVRDLRPGASLEEKYQALYDAYFMLIKRLTHLLSYLDSENVSELDANVTKIRNLVAETIITQTLVTQTLYAEKGYIAELTVDQLDTSAKVKNYLLKVTDYLASIAEVNYIKIYEQNIEFRTGKVKTDEGGTPLEEQAVDRFDKKLYWVDDTYKAVQYEANDKPVMVYQYDELVKMHITFDLDPLTNEYEPKITLGAGVGNETYPDRGKAFIHKDSEGLLLKYIRSDGEEVYLRLGENGAEGNVGKDVEVTGIDFTLGGMDVAYADEQVHNWEFTYDTDGRISLMKNMSTNRNITVSYSGS